MRADLTTTRIRLAEHSYPAPTRRIMAGHSSEAYKANPVSNGSVTVATPVKTYRRLADGSERLYTVGKVNKQPLDDRRAADLRAQAANHVDVDGWAHKV